MKVILPFFVPYVLGRLRLCAQGDKNLIIIMIGIKSSMSSERGAERGEGEGIRCYCSRLLTYILIAQASYSSLGTLASFQRSENG